MNSEMHDSSQAASRLSKLLREWKVESSLPPRFGEQVWERIARVEERTAKTSLAVLRLWLERRFARPGFAVSYVVILLAAALGIGLWQAHDKATAGGKEWRENYVKMVDPYQMPRN